MYTFYPYFRTLFLTFGLAVSRFSMSFSACICIAYVKVSPDHKQRRMKKLSSIDIPQHSRLSFHNDISLVAVSPMIRLAMCQTETRCKN